MTAAKRKPTTATAAPQRRPHGPLLPTPRSWKEIVLASGKTQADLVRITGATSAAISHLFARNADGSERVQQSRYRAVIDRALSITETGADPLKAAIDADWHFLDDDDRAAVRMLVERLAVKKR